MELLMSICAVRTGYLRLLYLSASFPEMPTIIPIIALIILLIAAVILVRSLKSSGKPKVQKKKKSKKGSRQEETGKKGKKQVIKNEPDPGPKTVLDSIDDGGTILLGQNVGGTSGNSTVVNPSTPMLTIIDAANPDQRGTVCMNQTYRLGRDEEACDIVFPTDPYISREQCEIYCQNGTVTIRNLSQKNITRINNKEVRYPMTLNSGMEILIGNTTLRVELRLSN